MARVSRIRLSCQVVVCGFPTRLCGGRLEHEAVEDELNVSVIVESLCYMVDLGVLQRGV